MNVLQIIPLLIVLIILSPIASSVMAGPFQGPFGPAQPIITEPGVIFQSAFIDVVTLVANTSQQIAIPSMITGTVKSSTFTLGETITQTGTGVTATLLVVPGSTGPLMVGALSAAGANAIGTWTGGSSGAVFTPTTVPVLEEYVLFSVSGGNDFYMKFVNSSIAVPSANATNGTAPELNPLLRSCAGKTYISLVSGAACNVTLAFYPN